MKTRHLTLSVIVCAITLSTSHGQLSSPCDTNGDGYCDAADIDAMTQKVLDGNATPDQRIALIESSYGFATAIGDSDLNGRFDEQDIVSAFEAGLYLSGEHAGWELGDWDGNFLFDEQDFVAAFAAGGYLLDPCDVNMDGTCDADDIDAMSQLVLDGNATEEERTSLIESSMPDGFGTYIGDSDLNGRFDEQDIVTAFIGGKYLTGQRAGWVEGDWDGNLVFDTQDFVAVFVASCHWGGCFPRPRGAVSAIPEPTTGFLLAVALASLGYCRRY